MSRKLNVHVREAIAEIVEREISDPRLSLVTIRDVEVAPDASVATVFYTSLDSDLVSQDPSRSGGDPLPDEHEVEAGFASASSRIRSLLGQRLSTRRTPELRFVRDPVAEQAGRVEELLRRMRDEGP